MQAGNELNSKPSTQKYKLERYIKSTGIVLFDQEIKGYFRDTEDSPTYDI